jgi:hypothetical protein
MLGHQKPTSSILCLGSLVLDIIDSLLLGPDGWRMDQSLVRLGGSSNIVFRLYRLGLALVLSFLFGTGRFRGGGL